MRFLKRLVFGLIATLFFAGVIGAFSGQGAAIAAAIIGTVVSVLVAVQRDDGGDGVDAGDSGDGGDDSDGSDSGGGDSGGGGDGGGD